MVEFKIIYTQQDYKTSEAVSTKSAYPEGSLCRTPWRHKAVYGPPYKVGVCPTTIRTWRYITSGKCDV